MSILITELLSDLLATKPSETDGVESILAIDGVPVVEPSRLEKLKSFTSKIIKKYGTIVNEHYPTKPDGSTKGSVSFIIF